MRDGKRTLLLAEQGLADELLPLAGSWVASWLIDPFVIVPVPATPSGSPLVTRMPGSVVGRDGIREVDVFDLLAQGEFQLIRFVALQGVEPGRPLLDREALLEYAMSVQQAASPVTRFWRLNLMAFPTGAPPVAPIDRLMPGWEANVIAAPENRASDRSFDAYVVAGPRGDYLGHLLGNAATAGAMWCGMDVGPYDERTPSGGASTVVALQRTFVRAVVMDDFLVRVARSGLGRLLTDESPFDDPVLMAGGHLIAHEVVPESQIGRVVDVLVETMMAATPDSALAYRMRGKGMPLSVEPHQIGVLGALQSFGRFSLDKLVTVPRFLLFRGQQRIAARFTRTLHGDAGDARIVLGRDPIGDLSLFVRDLQLAEQQKAEVLAELERGTVDVDFADAQYRELWSTMRTVAFAMYDGRLGSAQADTAPGQVRQRLLDAGFHVPEPAGAGASDEVQRSLVMPTKTSLLPDWRDDFLVPEELVALLGEDTKPLPERIGWIALDEAETVWVAVEHRAQRLRRDVASADERRSELRMDLDRATRAHGEIVPAQRELDHWRVAIEGREVSSSAVERLRRIFGRFPATVLELASEVAGGEDRAQPVAAVDVTHDSKDDGDVGAADTSVVPAPPDVADAPTDDAVPVADLAAESSDEEVPEAEDTDVPADRSDDATPQVGRWWHRLLFWQRLASRRRPGSLHLDEDNAAEIAIALAARLDEERARLEDEIVGLRDAEVEVEREIEVAEEQERRFDEAAIPFRRWLGRNGASFAWRLLLRMRDERRALSADLESTRAWLSSALPVSPEEALQLFERFVRRLRRLYLWGLIVPGIVFVLVRTVLSDLARRLGDWIMSTWVGRFVETDLGRVLADAVRAFLGNPWPYLIAFVLSGTAYAFISYYRAWSQRQRRLRQLRSDVDHMRRWVSDLKVERRRLQQLERHSTDVLRLLSEFLHRPFGIPSAPIRGRGAGPVGGSSRTRTLNVAEPLWDATWQGQHSFESRILARHARRGWLEDTYRRLATTVEEVTGQPKGTFGVDRLDESARSRAALLHLIEAGETDPRRIVGERLEREVLRDMIAWDLSDDLPFPMVIETRTSATDGIDVRLDLLDDETSGVHPWIDFMLHGLPSEEPGMPSGEWAPWTVSVAVGDEVRRDLRTVVHGPARYRRDVEAHPRTTFIALREGEIRPVELLVRIDHAMNRPLADVRGCEGNGTSSVTSVPEDVTPRWVATDEELDV